MPRQRLFLITIFLTAVITNLLGVFLPETGFDALWYHLTIPKLYLAAEQVYHIPGGLLYYSEMPRLTEFIYMILLKQLGSTWPHLVNFCFGLGAAFITYKLARNFLSPQKSLLATAIFYVTPTVGWLSNSAYIDLPRTFFEGAALYLVFSKKYFVSAFMLGLAISTKTLALGTVPIFGLLVFLQERKLGKTLGYVLLPVCIALPWFYSSYQNTGYPFYPIGAGILDTTHSIFPGLFAPWSLVTDLLKITVTPDDLLTPVYFLIVPFVLLTYKKLSIHAKRLVWVAILSYLVWWITPRTGGGRFFLPYTPIWAVMTVVVLEALTSKLLKKILLLTIILTLTLNCFYRAASVGRGLPVILGQISNQEYLCTTLDFTTGVFVDCDNFFKETLKNTDLVYVQGVHNLYYLDFPFVHESWYRGENATYFLLYGDQEPIYRGQRVPNSAMIHSNPLTRTKVYKL